MLHASMAILVVLAVGALLAPDVGRVEITVDGEPMRVRRGATVGALVENRMIRVPAGDVRDVAGVVVVWGGGEPGSVYRSGRRLGDAVWVKQGDRLELVRGADTTESLVATQVAIEIPVEHVGKGPLLSLECPGAAGLREDMVGEYSGKVAESHVLREPVPLTYRRYSPPGSDRVVALTFDDGPWPGQTERILEILAAEDVKATFFMVGRMVYANQDLARRVAAEGHLIGNHTQSHARLTRLGPAGVRDQITSGQIAIQEVVGVEPRWFRPPGGGMSPQVDQECARLDLQVAMWTVDPQDWRTRYVGPILERTLSAVKPGAVILLHDGGGDRTATIVALGPLIRELKKQEYGFVTLDELAASP